MTSRHINIGRLIAGGALLFATSLAMAQYMWIDDKGVKQFSDRPPPPSVPDKRILKAPGKPLFNPYAPAEVDGAAPAMADGADATVKKPATVAERNADYNKRKTEAAQAARQAADDAAYQADVKANCDAARKNQLALDQGVRISSYDKNGERGIMSDEERAETAKKNKKVLADCK